MAVTSDNKLLLCNYKSSHPKVYKCIYKDYKTIHSYKLLIMNSFIKSYTTIH
jgi:hypothetical protein